MIGKSQGWLVYGTHGLTPPKTGLPINRLLPFVLFMGFSANALFLSVVPYSGFMLWSHACIMKG